MKQYREGLKVRLLMEDCDTDHNGKERIIPVGTTGALKPAHIEPDLGQMWHVIWDMNRLDGEGDPEFAWTIWSEAELGKGTEVVS